MTKNDFLRRIEKTIARLPEEERTDIIRDLEEHFYFATQEGKQEEEITATLGSPEKMGKEIVATYRMEQVNQKQSVSNVIRAIWSVIGLSLFNVIIVLGPFIALVGLIFAGWLMGGSFIASPILYGINGLIYPAGFTLFEFFLSILFAGCGIFIVIGMYYVTKMIIPQFMRYINWNYRMMKGGSQS